MSEIAKIKEIFASIQGEGLLVGVQQIFIRFCKCNLACKYCDTDFSSDYKTYSSQELIEYLQNNFNLNTVNSVSLTGGEPLLWTDFLKEFLPKLELPVYLETNGTVSERLEEVLPYVDYISADIKLPSCSGVKDSFEKHELFFEKAAKSDSILFAKVVFDENITDEEIEKTAMLAKKYGFEIILQPMMIGDRMSVGSQFIEQVFEKFLKLYNKTRVIPQVHKFLNVE